MGDKNMGNHNDTMERVMGKMFTGQPGVLDEIRRITLEEAGRLGLKVERIILFGSRARGEAREESDYDILVVVEEAEWRKRRKLSQAVRRRLAEIGKPADIIVTDRLRWEKYREEVGHIFYTIKREGVTIAPL